MNALGLVLLIVSLTSLSVYLVSLYKLLTNSKQIGLVRTAICRVTAACLYTVIAMSTLAHKPNTGILSMVVFVIVQLMWQANSIADVRLGHRGRHIREK
jgi:hypothetical protein